MKIAVVTIGDELLNGEVVDTNTALIARALRCEGYVIDQAITLPDQPQEIATTLQALNKQGSAVLVSGGLGPTRDDLTARAAAQAFHLTLSLNELALRQIEAFFDKAGKPMPPGNEKQALIPHKAQVMENRCGTAPGFIITHNRCPLFFMPGVPHEMEAMLHQQVIPALRRQLAPTLFCGERVVKVFGLPESDIERQLPASLFPDSVALSFRLEYPLVLVKLNTSGKQESDLDDAERLVCERLRHHVVARGNQTLPQVVHQLLCNAEVTLSLAESCTGGMIATLLTDQAGSSAYLERGAVTYANSAKHDWLGIPNELLLEKGAVSAECARGMANGIRQRARTDYALAVTGIAGPGGGTAEKPCGTVFIALATPQGTDIRECHFSGDRAQVRTKTAYTALDWLRRTLSGD